MTHHHHIQGVQEHMEVIGSDGQPVAVVDRLEGERIKLTKNSTDGGHHFIEADQVAEVRDGKVQLNVTAAEAKRAWQGHASVDEIASAGLGSAKGMMAEAGRDGGQGGGISMPEPSTKSG
jgi:hypothetical protein